MIYTSALYNRYMAHITWGVCDIQHFLYTLKQCQQLLADLIKGEAQQQPRKALFEPLAEVTALRMVQYVNCFFVKRGPIARSKLQCKLLTCAPLWQQFSSLPRDLGPKKAGTGQRMQIWKEKNKKSCQKTFLTWSPCYLSPVALTHDLSPPGLGRDGHTCCRKIKLKGGPSSILLYILYQTQV